MWAVLGRVQCKDCSGNCTGQTSRTLVTRLKEHQMVKKNCNRNSSLKSSRIPATQITGEQAHLKKRGVAAKKSINKWIDLPQAYPVLRAAISWRSQENSAASIRTKSKKPINIFLLVIKMVCSDKPKAQYGSHHKIPAFFFSLLLRGVVLLLL